MTDLSHIRQKANHNPFRSFVSVCCLFLFCFEFFISFGFLFGLGLFCFVFWGLFICLFLFSPPEIKILP